MLSILDCVLYPTFFRISCWINGDSLLKRIWKEHDNYFHHLFWKNQIAFSIFPQKKPFVTTRKERKDSKSVKQILFHYMGWKRDMSCPVFLHYNIHIFCSTYIYITLSKYSPVSSSIHSTFILDELEALRLQTNSNLKVNK